MRSLGRNVRAVSQRKAITANSISHETNETIDNDSKIGRLRGRSTSAGEAGDSFATAVAERDLCTRGMAIGGERFAVREWN